MTVDELIMRGEEAKRLLENPLLIEAFEVIENEVNELWKTSPSADAEGREKLYLSLRLLGRLKAQIQSVVETGKVEQATVTQRLLGRKLRSL